MQELPPTSTTKYLLYIVKQHQWLAIFTIVLFTLWDITLVMYPVVVQWLVDAITTAATKSEQLEVLQQTALIIFILLVVLYTLARATMIIFSRLVAASVVTAAQHQVNYVSRHSHQYFTNRFAGTINGKISSASDGLQGFLQQLMYDGYSRLITIATAMIVMSTVSYWFVLVFVVLIIVVILVDIKMVRKRRPINKAYSESNTKYRGKSVDLLSNVGAVRQYSRTDHELTNLSQYLEDRKKKFVDQVLAAQQVVFTNNIFSTVMNMAALGILYWQFSIDKVSVGQVVMVVILLATINRNINGIGGLLSNLGRQYVDIQHGLEDIYRPHEITDLPNADKLNVSAGKVTFKQVNFAYEADNTQTVFNDLALEIEPGQRVGLVGPSGAGKSTLVSLLLRQHDIQGGAITIDGQNIAAVTQDSLRSNIAVVPQEPLLFHRTIAENIKYGKPNATKKEMVEVAKKAQAHDFIEALPEKYETLVGERGVKLSGGQKQRVAIARAMLKDAPILVLDEATSALDSESEVAIQRALQELMKGKTVIAVAHRLSTLRKMDRILVIDNGKIIQDGTHEELTSQKGLYQKLWEHQAGGFLLE